jgi:hypothetical protein
VIAYLVLGEARHEIFVACTSSVIAFMLLEAGKLTVLN